jgi:sugar phosphate isomerase/epimerase
MLEFGLQTYTIKKLIKNPASLDKTLGEIAGYGISNIELAVDYLKFPFEIKTAELIASAAEKHGIKVVSCQIRYNTVIKDYDKAVAFFKALKCNYLTISVIDIRLLLRGEAGIREFAERLNALSEKLKLDGITLGHHNHHFEFLRYDGRMVLDMLVEYFKGEFVLDTYWVQRGGGNHIVLLQKLKGRVSIMHLRDYKVKFKKFDLVGSDTEIGEGNLPFKEIVKKASECGVKYGMIEQSTKTPLESVKTSITALKGL